MPVFDTNFVFNATAIYSLTISIVADLGLKLDIFAVRGLNFKKKTAKLGQYYFN